MNEIIYLQPNEYNTSNKSVQQYLITYLIFKLFANKTKAKLEYKCGKSKQNQKRCG